MFLHEFLWRGRADAATPPASHIVLAVPGKDALGRDRVDFTDALTPEQAEAAGLPLPAILAAINAEALNEIAGLRAVLRVAVVEAAGAAEERREQSAAEPVETGAAG